MGDLQLPFPIALTKPSLVLPLSPLRLHPLILGHDACLPSNLPPQLGALTPSAYSPQTTRSSRLPPFVAPRTGSLASGAGVLLEVTPQAYLPSSLAIQASAGAAVPSQSKSWKSARCIPPSRLRPDAAELGYQELSRAAQRRPPQGT